MTTKYRLSKRRITTRTQWEKEDLGVSVLDAARARIERIFREFDHVYVSFSGGKDSTAVLQCALDVLPANRRPLRVIFWDEECIAYETEDYIRRVSRMNDVAMEWYCLPVRERNMADPGDPWWFPWDPDLDPERWVRPMPPEAITTLAGFPMQPASARVSFQTANPLLAPVSTYGRACTLMGIRAEESLIRRMAVSNRRVDHWMHRLTPNLWKAYPVYDWTNDDVWLAPERLGWDYNRAYDVLTMAGYSIGQQRLAAPFAEESAQSLTMWAECFPDVWEKTCERVSGGAALARYAKTEMYSWGSRSEKPPGMTWQEYINERIKRHDAGLRGGITSKIRMMIRRHYARTSEPILEHSIHPESGVSWRLLQAMAERGDMKDRRSGQSYPVGKAHENARKAYDKEYAAWKAAGEPPI